MLLLLFDALQLFILLMGQALSVDVDIHRPGKGAGFSDDALEPLKLFQLRVVQLVELVIVEIAIFKAAVHDALDLRLLELPHHVIHIVRRHA